MLFSILIANYNNGKYFQDCYQSVIAQTYTDWEAIIVDDASTDDSLVTIKELIQSDTRFKLYRNDINNGCGYTKNKCAALAAGDIAGFLDPDDTLTPDALQLMAEAHQQNPQAALVHSRFFYCDEQLSKPTLYSVAGAVAVSERFTNLEARVNHFATFKNSFYKKTAGIDPALLRAVDQDLYLKLSETGSFYFVDKGLYNYRIHNAGIATSSIDKAFYWFLKVIMKAEERRKINLENEVAGYLNRSNPANLETNLANPRYLLLNMFRSFKKSPAFFLKKFFTG